MKIGTSGHASFAGLGRILRQRDEFRMSDW